MTPATPPLFPSQFADCTVSASVDSKTKKDTFDHCDWWRANGDKVPAFKYVLRAVLANSPNSIPPERVFSILNNTFDDDQHRAFTDYMELSL